MPRKRGIWYVTSPAGYRISQASRRSARAYVKEHGGARAGYRSNEYEHRKEAIRQRVGLGYVERVGGSIPSMARPESTMSKTLLANWRLAYAAGDLEAASRFADGVTVVNNYSTGGMDRGAYTEYMRDLYAYAVEHGYADPKTSFREWLYYGKG
jgi:hypothetical protein